ncbi:hypothetical protein PpBr36_07922 [Pyricularia pennisetigena]|uniref:hypothetical protein n=1 Tax=Pyricularia pennisetigena TaxID=1578925 RepID=UPI001152E336|nr:hypothetical protein PpBr36_07922 [Pyricularia pennisetigena]TLS25752.1 hypothetical protein PpBr36_07922 [Pyricularia pennisetigena]
MSCPRVPMELWFTILEPMAQEIVAAKRSNRFIRPGYGALASVCRHWQHIFEPKIFEHLTLQAADVQFLNVVVRERRRHLVKHIWFIIEFNMYSSQNSVIHPHDSLDSIPSHFFWLAINSLFQELSVWGPPYARGDKGVTLELSMWSPSDNKYSFQDIDLGEGDWFTSFPEIEDDFERHTFALHAPTHGWVLGSRVRSATRMEWQKLRHFICLEDDIDMPSVVAVTGLLLRRQTRTDLHVSAYNAICARLPNLAHVHLEMWQEWEEARIKDKTIELGSLVRLAFPPCIERATLLYDTSEAIREDLALKVFNCSFILSADEFFEHYLYSTYFYDRPLRAIEAARAHEFKWFYMNQFTMTSPSLQPGAPRSKVTQLVYSAGLAALDMPEVKKFQLWHAGDDYASLLSFEKGTWDINEIRLDEETWDWETDLDKIEPFGYVPISTWLDFNMDVLECEEPVRYTSTILDKNLIKCRGDAMHFLGLGPEIVRPISVHQMRREARGYAHV